MALISGNGIKSKFTKKEKTSPGYTGDYERKREVDENLEDSSSESIGSQPWKCRFRERLVPNNQFRRTVEPAGFFLCLLAVLLLCGGAVMCSVCIWAMLYRCPYSYLTTRSQLFDSNNFNLCGGLLSIPCCWLAWIAHDNRRNYLLLPLLIILLGFSITMLSTGTSLAIVNRSKMKFYSDTQPPQLVPSQYETSLNESMFKAMMCYDQNQSHRMAWNRVQYRLKCCGVHGWDDWKSIRKIIPTSCYATKTHIYARGCINVLAYDLAWQMCILTGFAFILFAIQAITMLFATFLYVKDKLTNRPTEQIDLSL